LSWFSERRIHDRKIAILPKHGHWNIDWVWRICLP
jgi:hypothetical protein